MPSGSSGSAVSTVTSSGRPPALSDWELAELVAERDRGNHTWEQIGFHFGIHKKTAQRAYAQAKRREARAGREV